MFEALPASPLPAGAPAAPRDAGTVRSWIAALAEPAPGLDDAGRIDLIRALEDLKSAAAAAQARLSVDFDASQREEQRAAGVPADRRGVGVAAQVALARRESPSRGGRHLGLARALVAEMPHTLAALSSGALSEWRATLLVRESACLSREDRSTLDREVAGDASALVGLGDRALVSRARAVAQRLDVGSVVARARRAESERCVTLRPAPDTMTYLTALLPVAQGVAVLAALTRAADRARAGGDPRTRGQAMADELVARVAAGRGGLAAGGRAGPHAGDRGGVPDRPPTRLQLQLVMTDRTLLAGDDEPAHVPGYGAVPGPWARDLVLAALDSPADPGVGATPVGGPADPSDMLPGGPPDTLPADRAGPLGRTEVWVRRLFAAPDSGRLVAMDSTARFAPRGLADLVRARDGACRTPWCDAPVRHVDHVVPRVEAGPTSAHNLQGLCEACNHAKQAPGWRATPVPPAGGRAGDGPVGDDGRRGDGCGPGDSGRPGDSDGRGDDGRATGGGRVRDGQQVGDTRQSGADDQVRDGRQVGDTRQSGADGQVGDGRAVDDARQARAGGRVRDGRQVDDARRAAAGGRVRDGRQVGDTRQSGADDQVGDGGRPSTDGEGRARPRGDGGSGSDDGSGSDGGSGRRHDGSRRGGGAPPTVDEALVAPDVVTVTPTGHRYVSHAPALPGTGPGRSRPRAA